MGNAFLFPGQGSQSVGMGKELIQENRKCNELINLASDILGYDLKKIIFEGPIDVLTDTQFAQPAIFTTSAMYLERAKQLGISYEYVVGHSLGEYSALYAAGVFSFQEGLELVAERGKAMSAQNGNGTMAAVLGLTDEELNNYLVPGVVIANINTKTQIVISGDTEGIKKVKDSIGTLAEVIPLNVSAAFHSPQMEEAASIMKEKIDEVEFREPIAVVVPNVSATPTRKASEIKEYLKQQITGQVRWYDSIRVLAELGVESFYECGSGNVLRKMNRAIVINPKCKSIS